MITINGIQFKYAKKSQFSLSNITLAISSGEIFTLLGPNGAGKTTLIRILSGLILPKSGNIQICRHDLFRDEYNARKSIGLVLGDERTFYFRLSGIQNLEFFGGLYGLQRRFLKKRLGEVMEMVGLQDDGKLQFMRYSSGMKKRLSMARALLHNPPALLLDEPNSGVDPKSARNIRDIIFHLRKQGRTILLTTHDMDEAEKMSDRIGFLKEGKLVKIGTVEEFRNIIGRRRLEIEFTDADWKCGDDSKGKLVTQMNNITGFDTIDFEGNRLIIGHNGNLDMNLVLNIISQEGLKISRVNTIEPSLEDVFIKLAG